MSNFLLSATATAADTATDTATAAAADTPTGTTTASRKFGVELPLIWLEHFRPHRRRDVLYLPCLRVVSLSISLSSVPPSAHTPARTYAHLHIHVRAHPLAATYNDVFAHTMGYGKLLFLVVNMFLVVNTEDDESHRSNP